MSRQPLSIGIIGSGFSGIGLALRLKEAGFTDISILEKADRLGGVWRDNAYPGAACDAPSHLYSYSFAPNPDWSRRFAEQPEILNYLERCAAGLAEHFRFRTEATHADFDETTGRWTVRCSDGSSRRFDLLVSACGQLSNPALPKLPGTDAFHGPLFHSARWEQNTEFAGKRVAVVGNGASAIQFVPIIAEHARELTIFQLEAHWISLKPDRVYPRWRKTLNRRVPFVQKLSRLGIFLWFELFLNPALVAPAGRRFLSAHIRLLCRLALRTVKDPALRRRLTPGYEPGCKRILTSGDYYATLNRPDVNVVDTPITEVLTDGLRTADGTDHPADIIILATGFRSQDFVAPLQVTGRDGLDLNTVWKDGARAHLGLTITGFPGFFLMYGPNTNVGSGSIVHMLESQITYIVQAAHLMATRTVTLDVRADTLDSFDTATQNRLSATVWNQGGCDSWYLDPHRRNTNNWPASMTAYRRATQTLKTTDYQHLNRLS